MNLTKKTVKSEVETTETVCEITQQEFEQVCAETAAESVVKFIGDDPELDDFMAGISLTRIFAGLTSKLVTKLFNDTNENPDKKEEK